MWIWSKVALNTAYRHEDNSGEGREIRCAFQGYTAGEWDARLFDTPLIVFFIYRQVTLDLFRG